jgi:hypothetical protein
MHFIRNAIARVSRTKVPIVIAAIQTMFAQLAAKNLGRQLKEITTFRQG